MAPAVLKMETRKQYNAFLTHNNGLARKEYAKMTSLHSYANLAEAERIIILWVYILLLVVFLLTPNSIPNMKALAQILFEISCTHYFQILISKGHNSKKGHNSDMKKYGSTIISSGICMCNF